MTTTEIKQQLCYYDKRNPFYSKEGRQILDSDNDCLCNTCRSGKHELANELLRVKEELKECKETLFTDYEE